ncbi:MAG: N-acetylmuramoyl-L-alanine amidase [Candidatus Omnitrophica bacterium]|nr:N-acetylmuramoyl-L-alanine amidase [Candidatus Omnitrophota bacterium]
MKIRNDEVIIILKRGGKCGERKIVNKRLKPLIIFALLVLILPGCAHQGAYVMPHYEYTATFGGVRYVSLSEFCSTHGFNYNIDKISHIAEIRFNTNTAKIMPDSNISLVNDSVKRFSPQAKLKGGAIYIPPSLAKYLEDAFKKKIEIPYLKKITIKRIVIDAGHGGKDPGAVGRSYKLKEKTVVLDIAKKLKEELLYIDDFEITLTRETDKFIPLWKRSDIANKINADLFISIHANASRSRRPKGFEVYYLSKATDDSARAIAAAENKVIVFENNSDSRKPHYLNATVWDMALTEYRAESQELAGFICKSAKKTLNVKDRGVKSARFYVLKGALMPAILVEVGFISNREEEWKLRSSAYRRKIAKAIAEGILAHKDKYERTKGFTKNID